jgi:hypothetical protein
MATTEDEARTLLERFRTHFETLKRASLRDAVEQAPENCQDSSWKDVSRDGVESIPAVAQWPDGVKCAHELHMLAVLHQQLAEHFYSSLSRLRDTLGRVELLQLERSALEYQIERFRERRLYVESQRAAAKTIQILGGSGARPENAAVLKEELQAELASREKLAAELAELGLQIEEARRRQITDEQRIQACVPAHAELERLVQALCRSLTAEHSDEVTEISTRMELGCANEKSQG